MRRFFALAVALCLASAADAAPLLGKIFLAETNLPTFDPTVFAPGPSIDAYAVTVSNLANSSPVTSLGLDLPGSLINLWNPTSTFRNSSSLYPGYWIYYIGESFFVIPPPLQLSGILAVDVVDDANGLRASYTYSGGGVFLPAGAGDTTVAVLSVLTGSPPPDFRLFTGSAVVNGVLETINFVPEPSTALLAGLAGVGLLPRRV